MDLSLRNKTYDFKKVVNKPDWICKQLYFSGSGKQEFRRQISVLVSNGYLQHTPLLLYLSKQLQAHAKIANVPFQNTIVTWRTEPISESDVRLSNDKTKNIVTGKLFDARQSFLVEGNDASGSEYSLDYKYTLEKIKDILAKFGSVKRCSTSYIAKKIIKESGQEINILLQDEETLEMEFYINLSKLKNKRNKRIRPAKKRRGGRKNKKQS